MSAILSLSPFYVSCSVPVQTLILNPWLRKYQDVIKTRQKAGPEISSLAATRKNKLKLVVEGGILYWESWLAIGNKKGHP